MYTYFPMRIHNFGLIIDNSKFLNRVLLFRKFFLFFYFVGRYLVAVIFKVMIQDDSKIGPKCLFSHKGNIIVGALQVGKNCRIYHNVTIGMNLGAGKNDTNLRPIIGNNVIVAPDSIVHGGITIGDGVVILSKSVLSKSVGDRCVVSGNPARIIKRDFDNTKLLNLTNWSEDLIQLIESVELSH